MKNIWERRVVWLCKCDCGNTAYVVGDDSKLGHRKSCGRKYKNHTHGDSFSRFYDKNETTKEMSSEKLKKLYDLFNNDVISIGQYILDNYAK